MSNNIYQNTHIPFDIKYTLYTNDHNDIITVTSYITFNGLDYVHDVSTYDIKNVTLLFDVDGEFLGVIPRSNHNIYQQYHQEQVYKDQEEDQTSSNKKRRKGENGQAIF
jgi:hypothetical protein